MKDIYGAALGLLVLIIAVLAIVSIVLELTGVAHA